MPYNARDFLTSPSAAARAEAAKFRCQSFYFVENGQKIRKALQQGHVVVIGARLEPEFNSGRWPVFTVREKQRGEEAVRRSRSKYDHHAMCIVGYDDTRKAFLLMNSWGDWWGQQGYCWVHYDVMDAVYPVEQNFAWEAWVLLDVKQKLGEVVPPPSVADRDVSVQGYTQYAGYQQNRHVWGWRTWIAGSQRALGNIRKVLWHIPDGRNIRDFTSTDPLTSFQIVATSGGTGTLNLTADVHFKDNTTKKVAYRFDFRRPAKRQLSLVQTDRYWGRRGNQPYWEWTLQLRGGLVDMADVKQVTYHLHPTYPIPNPTITGTAQNGFAFVTTGWGTFDVKATVQFRDGSTMLLSTPLKFRDPVGDVLILTNTARATTRVVNGALYYNWTAYVDGPLALLRQIHTVRYHLHPTFRPNAYDVRHGAEYGFPLSLNGWGEFGLRATVFFRNGTSQTIAGRLRLASAPVPQPRGK